MSTYPSPVSPIYPSIAPRPGSVTAISVIGIVLSCLGILCNGFNLLVNGVGLNMQMGAAGSASPSPALRIAGLGVGFVSIVIWVWLLIASVGSLRLRPWARRSMIYYSIVHLVALVATLIVTLLVINPETQKVVESQMAAMSRNSSGGPTPPNMAGVVGAAMVVGAIFWCIALSVFPIFALVIYRRPNIVAAFSGQGGAAPFAAFPIQQSGNWPAS